MVSRKRRFAIPYAVIVEHVGDKAELREALIGAGAVLNGEGDITGSMIISDAPARKEAEAYDGRDPYTLAVFINLAKS